MIDRPLFRVLLSGFKRVGPYIVKSGHRLERMDLTGEKPIWIYVDTLPPDMEDVKSYVRNTNGILCLHNQRTGFYIP